MVTTVTDNSPQSINTSLFAMDNEIQKVKKIAESFDEKLSGIDIETGVISVNGKQGVVELTASDVDALPSSTVIPTTTSELTNNSGFITINDVGSSFVPLTRKVNNKSLDKDITLTASDVGALPDTTVIPTKTSQLTNDSGFITSSGVGSSFVPVTRKVNNKQLNTDITLTASDVGALPDTTVIPTKTSQLTNDNEFITSSGSITGNAATATTADKVKNALTVNGKTYDGSTAIDAGVQTIANGGTGQTTQADINKAIVGELPEGNDVVTDGTEFVSSRASDNGFADTNAVNVPYKRKFSRVWEYIKGKISSVLGITNNKHIIKGETVDTNTYEDANPKLVFSNIDGSQEASLTFTDYDVVQYPASVTLNGNKGGEYFIAPNIKATDKFYGNLSGKADTAGTADKATKDASGNVITDTYLPLSGGAMTGNIQYKGSKSTDPMIKFIDNTDDAWGNGIGIGGGGATIIGGGESSDVLKSTITSGGDEVMKIGNDADVEIWTNLQDGIASGKKFTFGVDGNITTPLGTVALKGDIGEDLYYEDYRFDNPSWVPIGNVYFAGSLKTWTGDIRDKIISAQVVYGTGFYPWAILDHANPESPKTTLALFSANNVQGWCIVRVWYKR